LTGLSTIAECAAGVKAFKNRSGGPLRYFTFGQNAHGSVSCSGCKFNLNALDYTFEFPTKNIYEIPPPAAERALLLAAKEAADTAAAAAFALGWDAASLAMYKTTKDAAITCGADAANPAAECVTSVAATGYSCGTTSFLKTTTDLLETTSFEFNICQVTEKCGGVDDAMFPPALIPDSKVFILIDCLLPLNSIKLVTSTFFAVAGIAFTI